MFSLIRYANNILEICPTKNITRRKGKECIIKYRGAKYEGHLVTSNDSKKEINRALEELRKPPMNNTEVYRSSSVVNDSKKEINRALKELKKPPMNNTEVYRSSSVVNDGFLIVNATSMGTEGPNTATDDQFGESNDSDYEPNLSTTNETDYEENERDYEKKIPKTVPTEISMSDLSNNNTSLACDDNNLKVTQSQGKSGYKKNFCFYCHTLHYKISRHLENNHRDVYEVQKFLNLPKNSSERRDVIGLIRKKGNFLFNTRSEHNNGELIVSRRPNEKYRKTAKDYKACAICKAFFSTNTLRHHFKKCSGTNSSKRRKVMLLSKAVMGRIHNKASYLTRQKLFPPLREDDIVRKIRYDELVIIYANKMCSKYRQERYFEMIRHRIRLLGRFLRSIKKTNQDITDLASIFDAKFCESVQTAIDIEANLNKVTGHYKVPSVAFNLGTLIKVVGNIFINECIKNHEFEKQKNAKNFLKIFTQEINFNVNRAVSETQTQNQRRKTILLPSAEDIKKIHTYLFNKRQEALVELKKCFDLRYWLQLAEATLLSIQIFNRRRPGEIERILIEDFKNYESINEATNSALFESMSPANKEIARKYVRFTIRGKLNRTVPVLLDVNIVKCIETTLKLRRFAKVNRRNPYVFGLPGRKLQYMRSCALMRKYADACGAEHPERLRGTQLRKHIATTCISLNLAEQEVADLANFMGHAEKIHRDIYRQPIISRDILSMSKLLEAAQGGNEELDSSNEDENELENSKLSSDISKRKKRSTSPYGHVKRIRWTMEEKNAIVNFFESNIKRKKLPSFKDIEKCIDNNPDLKRRTIPQIKTWIHNRIKSKLQ